MKEKKERTGLVYNNLGKRIEIPSIIKVSEFGKARGLTFRRREKARALLFDFNKPVKMKIHSLFVFFDFIAIWLDKDDKIIEIKKVIPWRLSVSPSGKSYTRLIEVPINNFYLSTVENLVGKRFK